MSAEEAHMEIRYMNNLRIFLFAAYMIPIAIFYVPIFGFLQKEFLFLSLENWLRDLILPTIYIFSATIIILFIYNEVMLRPLFMRCRGGIHDYLLKYEVIDFLWRWILWGIVVELIFSGGGFLAYSSEVSELGWMIFIEFKTAFLSLVIGGSIILLVLTLFSYHWWAGADHIEKDKFENWLETDFPSFPIKSGIILFILLLTGVFFWAVYINYFINPGLASQTLLSSISAISFYLALSLLYYYLIKRIIGRFLEKHDTLLL